MIKVTTKYPFTGYIESRSGGREENQDYACFVDTPLGLLLVVCDGMGGGPGGRTASHLAIETILNLLSDVSENTDRAEALRFAIEKANDMIYSKSQEILELRGMGSTIAAIFINEQSAVIAHVGDSRIYQLRKGRILYRSADHSAVANLVRQGRLTEEQARNHPQSNVITRSLGIRPTVETEIGEVFFRCGDRFVLCSDGIWGAMPQDELVDSLSRPMGIEQLTELVADEVDEIGIKEGGGHDNLTLAILDTPFDSTKNIVKKRELSFFAFLSNLKKSVFFKYRFLFLLIFIMVAGIFVLVRYLKLNNVQQEEPQQVSTSTSQSKNESVAAKVDKTVAQSVPTTMVETDSSKKEAFMQVSEEIELTKKLDYVCSKVEKLKDRKLNNNKKLDCIKFVIKDLEYLSNTSLKSKKQEITDIVSKLKNKKGKPIIPKEKEIDKIKKSIESLKQACKEI